MSLAQTTRDVIEDETGGDYRIRRSPFRADCPEPFVLLWRGVRLAYFPTIAAARAGADTGGTQQSNFELQVGRAK